MFVPSTATLMLQTNIARQHAVYMFRIESLVYESLLEIPTA